MFACCCMTNMKGVSLKAEEKEQRPPVASGHFLLFFCPPRVGFRVAAGNDCTTGEAKGSELCSASEIEGSRGVHGETGEATTGRWNLTVFHAVGKERSNGGWDALELWSTFQSFPGRKGGRVEEWRGEQGDENSSL